MEIQKVNTSSKRIAEQYQFVAKANVLIQKARFDLTLVETKILNYLISKIKPEDSFLEPYIFSIREFCDVCELYSESGEYYAYIKKVIKKLKDRSVWIPLANGDETTAMWIERATISKTRGVIEIKLDEMMRPYLLHLKEQGNYYQFELIKTLALQSIYSARLYELLKSHAHMGQCCYEIDELKKRLNAENYKRFPDFRRFALEPATEEINELTELTIIPMLIKDGRKVVEISFSIKEKVGAELKFIVDRRHERRNRRRTGQLSLAPGLTGKEKAP